MADPPSPRVTPVILSGGAGTRLWPLSRTGRPKQMLALFEGETLLRQTADRVADPGLYNPPIVVAAADQAEAIEAEVEGIGRLILEPAPRNTAPAIALAALQAPGETLLLVLPSDHLILDPDGFSTAVRRALPFAQDGWIVTFGMTPDHPETGYGYIKRGAELGPGLFAVERFVEKPDLATAQGFLAEGGYAWNGGIFLMRADALTRGLRAHAPAILDAVQHAVREQRQDGRRISPGEAFGASPAVSIDYALMEKADKVAVAPVAVGWSDIGSWAALHQVGDTDENGNAVDGEVIAIDARNCVIRSEGPLVAAIGVKDLVIVATADAVLVVPRERSQRVKEVVDRLKAEGKQEWT